MFSRINRPTRRQFLQRSVLGAGGVLLSSSLLPSCTDHNLPGPGESPLIHPPVGGVYMNPVDWSDDAKAAVTTGLRMYPTAGEILGSLVHVLWPDPNQPEKVWNQVKTNMEDFVGQPIGSSEYEQIAKDLNSLKNYITMYLEELNLGSSEEKLITWLSVSVAFSLAQPHFQAPGYELPLLGLFGQFANMYLAVLRDGVLHGADWGRTPAEIAQDQSKLTKLIQEFTDYATTTCKNHHDYLKENTRIDYKNVEPFRTYNAFDRQMAFWVLDFRDTWPYYDAGQYPFGVPNLLLTREIYTDPMGEGTDRDFSFAVPAPGAALRPYQLNVYSRGHVAAIQMYYPYQSGLGGESEPRYGVRGAANTNVSDIPNENPLINVTVTWGSLVNSLQFFYAYNNQSTPVLGVEGGGNSKNWGYNYEAISSGYIQGSTEVDPKEDDYAANVIVFGFQYWLSPQATLQAIGNLYVNSPQERSAADFAKAFPKLGIAANSITAELKAARQAYWAALHARAVKLK